MGNGSPTSDETQNEAMNATKKPEALDVRQQRIDAILADAGLLHFVEISRCFDILSGIG
jgi:hypothetical protein